MITFLLLILAHAGSGTVTSAHPGEGLLLPSVNEFNVSELDLYNNLITCVSTFKVQFVQCNKQIQRLANTVFQVIEENSTLGGILKCCGVWMARDCWLRHARETCIDEHLPNVLILPFKLLPKLDQWCHVYHDQTFTCLLPQYAPYLALLLALLCTLIALSLIYWKVRQRRQRRRNLTQSKGTSTVADGSTATEITHSTSLLDVNQNLTDSTG